MGIILVYLYEGGDRLLGERELRYHRLLCELQAYERRQIELYLEGTPSSAELIASVCCVAEHPGNTYMRDYVPDERQQIAEIRFDRIRSC